MRTGFQSDDSSICSYTQEGEMGLMDALRHAEQQGKRAGHLGAERVRAGIHQVEASLHRRLGTIGQTNQAKQPVSAHTDPQQDGGRPPDQKVRTGIVSVNGQDVEQIRCTGR
jgi:hypothetical protein